MMGLLLWRMQKEMMENHKQMLFVIQRLEKDVLDCRKNHPHYYDGRNGKI